MVKNRSAPPGTIVPWLAYTNVGEAIAWLCGAFGFREHLRTPPEPDGSIHHAQISVGAGAVVLTTQPLQSGISLFIPVEDVDAHHERAVDFGARIVRPPATHGHLRYYQSHCRSGKYAKQCADQRIALGNSVVQEE